MFGTWYFSKIATRMCHRKEMGIAHVMLTSVVSNAARSGLVRTLLLVLLLLLCCCGERADDDDDGKDGRLYDGKSATVVESMTLCIREQ